MLRIEGCGVRGDIKIPSSKSITHRALICAALSGAECRVESSLDCEDIRATMQCLRALGADLVWTDSDVVIKGGVKPQKDALLDCRESGATLRFIMPICAALGGRYEFILSRALALRPHNELRELMTDSGIRFFETKGGFVIEGKMVSPNAYVEGKTTSQITSGFMLALPLCDGRVHPGDTSVSGNYIDLTQDIMCAYGARVEKDAQSGALVSKSGYTGRPVFTVEGDWSHAAVFLAMRGGIRVHGLNKDTLQGERRILDIIKQMGGEIIEEDGAFYSNLAHIHSVQVDISDVPDLIPALVCLMAVAKGTSRITGGARLRGKESSRLNASADVLRSMGIYVEVEGDGLTIMGGEFRGGEISTRGDHRLAMMTVACSTWTRDALVLDDHACVAKSYPTFWEDYVGIGGKISNQF